MKSYIKFLSKNKLYTAIEVVGMAVAIAFVLYIGTFLIGQFTSDSFIKKQGNVYVGRSERVYLTSGTVKGQLEGKFPEIEEICRVMGTSYFAGVSFDMMLEPDAQPMRQNAIIADENFFELFPFPLVEGDHSDALAAENSILLSEGFVAKFFSDESPMGRNIRIAIGGSETELVVTGVFKDFYNTVFSPPEIIYRADVIQSLMPSMLRNGSGVCATFYKLSEGADMAALEAGMGKVIKENDRIYIHGLYDEFHLTPFKDISTNEIEVIAPFEGVVPAEFISIFIAAGALLLIFAILNYISLTVAQTGFRAREMASRRLVGAQPGGIVLRYLAESFMLTSVSFGLALLLSHLFAPQFSELIGKDVYPLKHIGVVEAAFMAVLVLVLSLCSGIIPALLVSKYRPIDVVRGNFSRNSKMVVSKVLIVCQSVIAIACIAVAAVMLLQLRHMMSKPMGYERDGRIMVANANKASEYHVEDLKSVAGVEKVGWLNYEPMSVSMSGSTFHRNGGEEVKFDTFMGDRAAFEILGFKVIRQNAEPTEYSMWLPEPVMFALGLDYDCTAIELDDGYIPVCGIIEEFHKGTANMDEVHSEFMMVPWIIEMKNEEDFRMLQSLIVQVSGDENDAVKRIREFYRGKGFADDDIVVYSYNEVNRQKYPLENQNLSLISVFALLVVLLASMTMLAMSVYYSKQNSKTVALRRVMGCSRGELYRQTVSGFLKAVAIATLVACPAAFFVAGKWLENYSYRIPNYWWVYLLAFIVMVLVALLSVTWQTLRLINTNPVEALKKE